MRRLREALKRTYYLRTVTSGKDSEGNTYPVWNQAEEIKAIIRHGSGRMDVAAYGERAKYMLGMQYDGNRSIRVGDGICVYVDPDADPDYRVVAVRGLTGDCFRVYDLEAT